MGSVVHKIGYWQGWKVASSGIARAYIKAVRVAAQHSTARLAY